MSQGAKIKVRTTVKKNTKIFPLIKLDIENHRKGFEFVRENDEVLVFDYFTFESTLERKDFFKTQGVTFVVLKYC